MRNGSVVDLKISTGKISALVAGSEMYEVSISVRALEENLWKSILSECAGKVASLVELLQGRLSSAVMEVVTRHGSGLFPVPKQIDFRCSCPDSASMCKHVAATLYGVGARFDHQPDLLFLLRHVDAQELILQAGSVPVADAQTVLNQHQQLDTADLSALFGIELDEPPVAAPRPSLVQRLLRLLRSALGRSSAYLALRQPSRNSRRPLLSRRARRWQRCVRNRQKQSTQTNLSRAASRAICCRAGSCRGSCCALKSAESIAPPGRRKGASRNIWFNGKGWGRVKRNKSLTPRPVSFWENEPWRCALVHFEIEKWLMVRCGHNFCCAHSMLNKHNADHRHHIPKKFLKLQNWPEYEAGLRRRGSLTLWIEEDALAQWQSVGPNGQARYQDIAIKTCLVLRTVFKMALRQTEGLIASVLTLMNLTISAPDHTTVSRRAVGLTLPKLASSPKGPLHVLIDSTGLEVFGAGQWLKAKHGAKSRRIWRKLHLAVDADSGMIVAQVLTDQHTDDPSQWPLLAQIDEEIGQVMADGAYDGAPTYETIAHYGDDIEVVIPPRKTAVLGTELSPSNQRDRHIDMIHTQGRLGWQTATGYGQRALVETTMGRYKSLIGPRLRARGFEAQQIEAAIGVAVLNRMLAAGRPNSVHRQQVPA